MRQYPLTLFCEFKVSNDIVSFIRIIEPIFITRIILGTKPKPFVKILIPFHKTYVSVQGPCYKGGPHQRGGEVSLFPDPAACARRCPASRRRLDRSTPPLPAPTRPLLPARPGGAAVWLPRRPALTTARRATPARCPGAAVRAPAVASTGSQ